MIRLDYVKDHPIFRDGRRSTGLTDFDNWWQINWVMNSRWIEYGDHVLCSVRGDGASVTGMSVLRAEKNSDLANPASWTILHVDEPAIKATDMPAPFGNYPTSTAGNDLFIDPDTVTNGFQRLWYTFKSREGDLDRSDYSEWDQTFSGGAISATKDLGFSIAWDENVRLSNSGGQLIQDTDYTLQNIGTATNAQVTYLTDQSAETITFFYRTFAYRYSFYSDDGGLTWTYYGPFLSSTGRPHQFGQPSAFKYDDGTHGWHMVTTSTPDGPGSAFNYVRSTGPSGGSWIWEDDTKISDLGGNGFWHDTNAIGTGDYSDGTYVYMLGACGYGADISYTGDPETLEDLSTDIVDHFDYPSAFGIWRCPLSSMTNSGSWQYYHLNPIMLRHSVGKSASGGIWNPSVIGSGSNLRITHEAVGVVFPPVSGKMALGIRDGQYGKDFSALTLPKQSDYITGDLTFQITFVAKDIGFSLVKRGVSPFDDRVPDFDDGDFYIGVTNEGAVEVTHFFGNGTGSVRRTVKSADHLVSIGAEHALVVSFSATAVNVYLDSNTPVATGAGASTDLSDKNIVFATSGLQIKEFHGYIKQIKVLDSASNYTATTAAVASGTVGYYDFSSWSSGSPSTVNDSSPSGYDANVEDMVKRGSVITETEVTVSGQANSGYFPGRGIGYNRGTGGSQQHQAIYRGKPFADIWTDDPIPEGAAVVVKNLRTGRYLSDTGVQDDPYEWQTDRIKGFTRFSDGANFLETTDRVGDQTSLTMVAEKSDYSSPYNRYDMQHWHLISKTDGSYAIQNRACSRVLADDGIDLRVREWRDSYEERWLILQRHS